jgi:hypothetical protein
METTRMGLPRPALALAAAALLLAGCGSSSAPAKLDATITVADAQPKGGVQSLKVKKDGTVRLTVNSDTADEIHIHGYDLHKDVAKGGTVTFDFPAKIDGSFIIELENAKQTLANLAVEP